MHMRSEAQVRTMYSQIDTQIRKYPSYRLKRFLLRKKPAYGEHITKESGLCWWDREVFPFENLLE